MQTLYRKRNLIGNLEVEEEDRTRAWGIENAGLDEVTVCALLRNLDLDLYLGLLGELYRSDDKKPRQKRLKAS